MPDGPDTVDWAADWAHRWFLDDSGRDRLPLLHGVSGGWAFHVESFEALVRLARERREGPVRGSGHPIAAMKRLGFDRFARAWGLRLMATGTRDRIDKRLVAVIGEIPTPSMLEPLIAVARALGDGAVVAAADPRVYRRFVASGLRPHALVVGLGRQRAGLRAGRRHLRPLLEAVRRDPPSMTLDGIEIGPDAIAALAPIASRSLPWAVVEREAVQQFLAASGARSILLASDQHRIGRLTTEAARGAGVRTVVAQHGLPRIAVGLLPVVADRVATWSEDSLAWFMRHGTDPARLIITGNPRLDSARSTDREATRRRVEEKWGLGGSPNLLVALSPDAGRINATLLDVALRALEGMPGARLLVKLHPGQGEWSWVAGQIRSSAVADRVRIARAEPLAPLLAWADLTLLFRSTVALESLAHGTPVAVIAVDGAVSAADAELRDLAPPVVRRGRDVAEIAQEVAGDAGRAAYLDSRSGALERAVGALDGGSARRIARLLVEEAG